MPNWIENGVRISHTNKDKVDWLLTKVIHTEGDEESFDFNRIIEMPKALIGTQSPPRPVKTKKEADKINKDNESKPYSMGRTITEKESKELKSKYGADNWYDWSIKNWGVKWNASALNVEAEGFDDGAYWIDLQFNTPWETPDRIWESLHKRDFHIFGVWLDEDPSNQGDIDYGEYNHSGYNVRSEVSRD